MRKQSLISVNSCYKAIIRLEYAGYFPGRVYSMYVILCICGIDSKCFFNNIPNNATSNHYSRKKCFFYSIFKDFSCCFLQKGFFRAVEKCNYRCYKPSSLRVVACRGKTTVIINIFLNGASN